MSCLISNDLTDPEKVNSVLLCMIKSNHSNKKRCTDFHQLILIKTIIANYLPIFYLRMQLCEVAHPHQKKKIRERKKGETNEEMPLVKLSMCYTLSVTLVGACVAICPVNGEMSLKC